MSGVPPIEVAQQALGHQIQRNPTPPPGWNDPPPLTKSVRQVSFYFDLFVFTIPLKIYAIEKI